MQAAKLRISFTFQVPQVLCQQLDKRYPGREVLVPGQLICHAHAYTVGNWRCNGRENTLLDFQPRLSQLGVVGTAFEYGGSRSKRQDHVLCFVWQDNAPVKGISTACSLSR